MTQHGGVEETVAERAQTQSAPVTDGMRLTYGILGVLVVILAVTLSSGLTRGVAMPGPLGAAWSYLPVWIPMLLAVALAVGRRSEWHILGLRFGLLDIFWGIAGGLAARAVAAFAALGLTGSTGLVASPMLGGITLWFVVSAVILPVLIAPVVEELLFRGLLQRTATRLLDRRLPRLPSAVIAVAATSVVFALLHVAVTPTATTTVMLIASISTLAMGVAAGVIAAATGRIGGAILAHIVFNGVAVLLTWPA